MKISQLIKLLEDVLEKYGDLLVTKEIGTKEIKTVEVYTGGIWEASNDEEPVCVDLK